jgi:hypothetical protein
MLENSTTTPKLPFKQQQNIAKSHFFPIITFFLKDTPPTTRNVSPWSGWDSFHWRCLDSYSWSDLTVWSSAQSDITRFWFQNGPYCAAPYEWNIKRLVRSGKSSIRWRECNQPGSGPFWNIRLEVIAVWK